MNVRYFYSAIFHLIISFNLTAQSSADTIPRNYNFFLGGGAEFSAQTDKFDVTNDINLKSLSSM